jgi:uncharacterized protein YndB with AHSA1/START domain
MVLRHSLEIEAPIGKVFPLVEDPERIKLWMKGLEETVYVTARNRENPVGTRFKQRIREGRRVAEYEGEVTAYEKPTHLAVRIGNEKFAFDVDYRLTDLGGRTRLDYTAEGSTPGGLAAAGNVVFGWLAGRIARKQMKRLKAIAESPA